MAGTKGQANEIYSFSNLVKAQPSDRRVSGRQISNDQIAAFFHIGGMTGTPKLVRHTHANQVYQAWAMDLLFKSRSIRCSAYRTSTSAARSLRR